MTALLVTAALMADLLTAARESEFNPLAHALMAEPLLAVAVKVAEIVFVLAYIAVYRRSHPRVASLVAGLAVLAGGIGAWSNLP